MIERELKYDPLERSGQIEVHAWLLIWSWGFLIPAGTLIWTHTKRHRDLSHPAIHVISSGLLGIVLALTGFGYGINKFSTFSRSGVSSFRMAHAVIGTIAMAGMLFQILTLAFMRPASVGARTPVGPGYVKAGHYVHRYLGFLWMFMGLVACEMGTHISSVTSEEYLYLGLDHENEKYAGGLIAALTATAFVTVTMVFMYDASATTAVAPEPYHGTKSQQQGISFVGDVEIPQEEAFEIGDLEMEDVVLSQ